MMGMADLVTVQVLKDGLEHLAANPDHCRYILGAFLCGPVSKAVDQELINHAVEFITSNRINVAPYYELDIAQTPSLAVVSSGSEDVQFLGDYGSEEQPLRYLPPVVYATFDAIKIEKTKITVSKGYELDKKIWRNVIVANGERTARVKCISLGPQGQTVLELDTDVTGAALRGWKAQSLPRGKGLEINSSVDKTTVQINFLSNGQASVHRLLSVVVRYCLKRGRRFFEYYGFHNVRVSYTPPMLNDDSKMEYQTVFTLEGQMTDSWIAGEFDLNDNTRRLVIHPFIATPVDEERNEEVILG